MAKNEYIGKRVTATLPEDVYEALLQDAELNGVKYSSRATQILTLFLKGKLALVDTLGVTTSVSIKEPTIVAKESFINKIEEQKFNNEVLQDREESKLGKAKTNANKGKFGKKP